MAIHSFKTLKNCFAEFPPRMKPASFSVDQIVEKMNETIAGSS